MIADPSPFSFPPRSQKEVRFFSFLPSSLRADPGVMTLFSFFFARPGRAAAKELLFLIEGRYNCENQDFPFPSSSKRKTARWSLILTSLPSLLQRENFLPLLSAPLYRQLFFFFTLHNQMAEVRLTGTITASPFFLSSPHERTENDPSSFPSDRRRDMDRDFLTRRRHRAGFL